MALTQAVQKIGALETTLTAQQTLLAQLLQAGRNVAAGNLKLSMDGDRVLFEPADPMAGVPEDPRINEVNELSPGGAIVMPRVAKAQVPAPSLLDHVCRSVWVGSATKLGTLVAWSSSHAACGDAKCTAVCGQMR